VDDPLISRDIFRGGIEASAEERVKSPPKRKGSGVSTESSHVRIWDIRAARATPREQKEVPSRRKEGERERERERERCASRKLIHDATRCSAMRSVEYCADWTRIIMDFQLVAKGCTSAWRYVSILGTHTFSKLFPSKKNHITKK